VEPDPSDEILVRLAKEARIELLPMGGEKYVPVSAAPQLLDLALREGIGVLGIEGFNVDGKYLVPDIGTIVSFEKIVGLESSRRRTEAAIALVKELASEVSLVCITFE
jgi:hypothetical protein